MIWATTLYSTYTSRLTLSIEDLEGLNAKHYILEEIADFHDAKVYRSVPTGTIQ